MTPLAKVGGLADVVGALAAEQARRGHRVDRGAARLSRPASCPPAGRTQPLGGAEVPWGLGSEPARSSCAERAAARGARACCWSTIAASGVSSTAPASTTTRATRRGLRRQRRALPVLRARRAGGAGAAGRARRHPARPRPPGGWAPCFVRTHVADEPAFAGAATVFTIHNLGYQGIHDAWVLALAGFGARAVLSGGPVRVLGPRQLHEGRARVRRHALDREPALRARDPDRAASSASGSRACWRGAAPTCAAS